MVTKLLFYPEEDSLKLISSAEDNLIKVWDLVLRTDIATLKAHTSLVTSIVFTTDKNTLISGSRDGNIAFWNTKDNYKQISLVKKASPADEEINAIYYLNVNSHPYVVIGGTSGLLSIMDVKTQNIIYTEQNLTNVV